jgi:hypothetical protein
MAIEHARDAEAPAAFLVSGDGAILSIPIRAHSTPKPASPTGNAKSLQFLATLANALDEHSDGPVIVDAEITAAALGVSYRTAHRALQSLAADGLAWPMPPAKQTKAGRPRQPYRLLVEKLPAS